MNQKIDNTLQNLNDCGCCEGRTVKTPIEITNRQGLTAIAYRIGTHAQFKQSMLAQLSSSHLTTRANDDFTIALLDAWATVADVLTFYQERIANESYLRTATERVSILNMARLIGYELHPGVAAGTYLAFNLENAPRAPHKVFIDIGSKVQSIPGQGEQAQTFETIEKIEAHPEWNAIKPRLTRRHPVRRNMDTFFFEGVTTGLKPGDGLLIIPDDKSDPVFRQVKETTKQSEHQRTLVKLQPSITASSASTMASGADRVPNPGPITKNYLNKIISAVNLNAEAYIGNFKAQEIFNNVAALQSTPPTIFAFRTIAAIFGHNAPQFESLPYNQRIGEYGPKPDPDPKIKVKIEFTPGIYSNRDNNSWVDTKLNNYHKQPDELQNILYLDNTYTGIAKDSWAVLRDGTKWSLYQIQDTTELTKSDFALTSNVTRLTLKRTDDFNMFGIRTTTVFAQSEALPLARMPIEEPVSGKQIELDGLVDDGLSSGQTIIICGELDQYRGVHGCEVATIAQVEHVLDLEIDSYTRITLITRLNNSYVRDTVSINANIARATNGETVQEVLGGGDATQPYQRFTLRQPPLTYISAPTPSGAESTLQVRINDLLWHEVPTLYGQDPGDRVFVTRTGDDGKTTVQFGDGQTGMRLTTGQENVRATYRKGIGLAGNVDVGQLSLLMTRPLGVKSVTNPLGAKGAADRESLDDARDNAPLTVLTMDRIVSLLDYEDFARSFAGIAKALTTWAWDGQTSSVFVTVAGPNGAGIDSDSDLYKNLLSAMQKAGDPYVPIRVESYRRALFRIAVRVKVNPDYRSEQVLAAVERSLRSHFSFNARDFGQPIMLSEVMAVIQAVCGVQAVDVDKLYRHGEEAKLNSGLAAAAPQAGTSGAVSAAELLLLDPAPLDDLGVML